MLLFDMGLCTSFPFIIIAALTGITNDHNRDEMLSLTAVQASWMGSIAYIFEIVGAILSAIITGTSDENFIILMKKKNQKQKQIQQNQS